MIKPERKPEIVIIIGLPGSGKTTFAEQNLAASYNIYDDYLTHMPCFAIAADLKNGKNTCLIDPRLCIYKNFHKLMCNLNNVKNYNIKVILFENNIEQCIKNVNNRADGRNIKIIGSLSTVYNTKNYGNFDYEIMPCFSI